jgi:hypothetical protein
VDERRHGRIERMTELVRTAHEGQTRNGGRVPYRVHLKAVADICLDALTATRETSSTLGEDLILTAYGHDLYEDTTVSRTRVRTEFGDRVDRWIEALTNRHSDTDRMAYLSTLANAEDEVRIVKCADQIDNMLSVSYGLHDLGLPWVRDFFLPIAAETRDALLARPFNRLPSTGGHMTTQVDWAWRRLLDAVTAVQGEAWVEDVKAVEGAASSGILTA